MTPTKTLFAVSFALGLLVLGGCSSNNTDSAANVPGAPSGPQPAAAGGVKTGNVATP